ncbi:uncharacterized protein LOC132654649 [Meriones unguiculatus]|uniref:uncharacterized protein LOC132654649 n=1 Tax=Meriones unguiculatus TaxID=10047 RepID=UPI00293E57EF|nr:uncharacterized protein LOC132654649 [Meriones unguiculatus]
MPMMVKKKKKKPKQKRYPQSRAGGPWDDDNAYEPKDHPVAPRSLKSGIGPSQPTAVGTEYGLVSREVLKHDHTERVTSCPEQPPETVANAQIKLRVEDHRGNSPVSENQDKNLLHQEEHKSPALSYLKLDVSRIEGPSSVKRTPIDSATHEVATLLGGCPPILGQEIMNRVSKPTTEKVLSSLTLSSTASNPVEDFLKEGNSKSKMTKLQMFPDRVSDVKELKPETSLKHKEETSLFASKEWKDQELIQAPGLEGELFKRTTGDGKSRKGRGSGKVRAGCGKLGAKYEVPFLLKSEKGAGAVPLPSEPVPETRIVSTEAPRRGVDLDPSTQPGASTDFTEAVVKVAREEADSGVESTMQPLIALETGSNLTQTLDARTERAEVKNMSISNQSKEGKCPWMDHDSTPRISEKTKKRVSEGRNKKLKNNYPVQPSRMEGKEEIVSPPCVEKESDNGNVAHKNRELGQIFPKIHDSLFSCASYTPTGEVSDKKSKNVESKSVELGALVENKANSVQGSAVTAKAAEVSTQDPIQVTRFVPSVESEESKTHVAMAHTGVADKPNKRSNDGKCKKVKNSFPEKHILQIKTDTTKMHIPVETTGDCKIEGMGYMDENRNITFTSERTPLELMNKSAPVEAKGSAGCETLPCPTPQVVKEDDSFPDTSRKNGQESLLAQNSKLLAQDMCSKDGVPGQEQPKALSAAVPSTSPGDVETFTEAQEKFSSHGDHSLKNKGEIAGCRRNEVGTIPERHEVGESESEQPGSSKHSAQHPMEPAKGHFLPGVLTESQSLPEEVRVLDTHADSRDLPASLVKKEKRTEDSAQVQKPDPLSSKAQKFSLSEDQNERESKGPDSLDKKVAISPENEKDKLKETSLSCEVTKLERVTMLTTELQSDVSCGSVEGESKVEVTAYKDPQVLEFKGNGVGAPQKMTGMSELKVLGEKKKEDKGRMAEPVKGYMRPTKSRGLTPHLPRSASQERERSKLLKSSGMTLPWGSVCACGF